LSRAGTKIDVYSMLSMFGTILCYRYSRNHRLLSWFSMLIASSHRDQPCETIETVHIWHPITGVVNGSYRFFLGYNFGWNVNEFLKFLIRAIGWYQWNHTGPILRKFLMCVNINLFFFNLGMIILFTINYKLNN